LIRGSGGWPNVPFEHQIGGRGAGVCPIARGYGVGALGDGGCGRRHPRRRPNKVSAAVDCPRLTQSGSKLKKGCVWRPRRSEPFLPSTSRAHQEPYNGLVVIP
jgi:hypothetical protein